MSEIRNLTRNGETFYPLTTSSAVINESTGEGMVIDEEPIFGSDNLVKSKGIYASLNRALGTTIEVQSVGQYEAVDLKGFILPIGTKIKNIGDNAFYIYGTDYISRGQTVTLIQPISMVKSNASNQNIKIKVYGLIDETNMIPQIKNVSDNISSTYELNLSFNVQYEVQEILEIPKGAIIESMIDYPRNVICYCYDQDSINWFQLNPGDYKVLPFEIKYIKADTPGTLRLKITVNKSIKDIDFINGFDITLNIPRQYEEVNLDTILPLGTTITNIGDNAFYIYGTDYIKSGQTVMLVRNVNRIKSNSADQTISIHIHGLKDYIDEQSSIRTKKLLSIRIFKKVGCIGDSFTSGHIQLDGEPYYADNPEYAYPHYMSLITGNEYLNFGYGGSTTKTWVNNIFNVRHIAEPGNKCQAYIIGLGINDSNSGSGGYIPAGDSSDFGTDRDTYAAWYYKLIQMVINVNPLAKIFVNTEPRMGDNDYNNIVRSLCQYCKNNNQNVYLVDLSQYNTKEYWKNPIYLNDFTNYHHTALGYDLMAEFLSEILSEVINNNQLDFKDVFHIPYD